MNSRGSVFLAVVWLGSSPTPFPPITSVSSNSDTQEDWERETTCSGETGLGGEGGGWAKSYDSKKAWSSINHSMLSGHNKPTSPHTNIGTERGVKNTISLFWMDVVWSVSYTCWLKIAWRSLAKYTLVQSPICTHLQKLWASVSTEGRTGQFM